MITARTGPGQNLRSSIRPIGTSYVPGNPSIREDSIMSGCRRISNRLASAAVGTFVAIGLCSAGDASVRASDGDEDKPRLLYLSAGADGPVGEALAECDRLTIKEYESRGVTVIRRGPAEFEKWLAREGKSHAKAHVGFQHVAYARKHKADAVGGIAVSDTHNELAEAMMLGPGPHFYAWGITLSGLTLNDVFAFKPADTPSAIPLHLGGHRQDPWAIPHILRRQPCSSPDPNSFNPFRGRPFLGVMLEGRAVTSVTAGSPAESAGLKPGDEIVSVDDESIESLADLAGLLLPRKAGDEIDLQYRRDGKSIQKRVKLADRHELLEVKLSWIGKAVPDLVEKDIHGETVRLRDFRGKVVLLEFWATWCAPCVEEMPLMQLAWERFKDRGLVWIGVSVDDDEQAWKDFVNNNRLGGIHLHARDWGEALNVSGYPTVLLVDTAGVVQCKLRGEAIGGAIAAMLAE